MKKRAIIVSFEGIDGCGKSTQAKKFVNHLKSQGFDVLFFKEPGTTKIGKKLRKILLVKTDDIHPLTELFLYLAARNQLVAEQILPLLTQKKVIVLDRFMDSTVAYQGYGRGLPVELINLAHNIILKNIKPDITFVIDASASILHREVKKNPDRLEKSVKFQEKVRRGYFNIHRSEPGRVKIIKRQSIEKTFAQIKNEWDKFVNEYPANTSFLQKLG
ncbi:MAG TPA: dTMP kinase [bacterium]|nr:dTMP kinase [bacterium]HOL49360.1 dTMP kinase [bacterium]HPO51893.1 dTMP kinase [bacterium]HXK44685.1 dTMP kinase [bacterium]